MTTSDPNTPLTLFRKHLDICDIRLLTDFSGPEWAAFGQMLSAYQTEEFALRPDATRFAEILQAMREECETGSIRIHLLFCRELPDSSGKLPARSCKETTDPSDKLTDWSYRESADASEPETAIGFCISLPSLTRILLRDFYILPELRRKGFGTCLFAGISADYDALGTREFHLVSSPDALPFWEFLGFRNDASLSTIFGGFGMHFTGPTSVSPNY